MFEKSIFEDGYSKMQYVIDFPKEFDNSKNILSFFTFMVWEWYVREYKKL